MGQRDGGEGRGLEGASYRELRLLEEVAASPEVSQRRLAFRLGIALGVANLLIKNLVRKGYIRATRAGWRRWVYSLTPAGITRKAQLTLNYADRFLDHYRRVRTLLQEDLDALTAAPDSRFAIYGTTELAELVYLILSDAGIQEVHFYDGEGAAGLKFLGTNVRGLDELDPRTYTKVIIAASTEIEARMSELEAAGIPGSQIVALLQNTSNGNGEVQSAESNVGGASEKA